MTPSFRTTASVIALTVAALAAPTLAHAKRMGSGGKSSFSSSRTAKAPATPAPAATAAPVAATVSYYGVGLEQLLPASPTASAPCLLHIAGNDGFVPPPAREIILAEVAKRPALQAHVYEGRDHAFARPHGEHYDAAAAELAQARTLAFLQA